MMTSSIKKEAFQLNHWSLLTTRIAPPFFNNDPLLHTKININSSVFRIRILL